MFLSVLLVCSRTICLVPTEIRGHLISLTRGRKSQKSSPGTSAYLLSHLSSSCSPDVEKFLLLFSWELLATMEHTLSDASGWVLS